MAKKDKKTFWGSLFDSLFYQIFYTLKKIFTVDYLIKFLKEKTIKLALKKLLLTGGFKAWIVSYIITEFYDEIGEPLIKAGLINIGYVKDRIEGKLTSKKIAKARRYQNAEDYHDAVDDVFNS